MDFVLWKPSSDEQPGWDSPWGYGRPGWHIECSAMAYELLGESFDIHGGGNDLMFPHHENEIAQSCCAHPEGGFAQVWMHNEMLQVEGKKMSKSLGNFFTVRDLLDQGVLGEVIRFVFLSTHYRKPMDWTAAKAEEAERTLEDWAFILLEAGYNSEMVKLLKKQEKWVPSPDVMAYIANDLNTAGAISELHKLKKAGSAVGISEFAATLDFLGLIQDWDSLHIVSRAGVSSVGESNHHALIANLMLDRDEAKRQSDWTTADEIRNLLIKAGVVVQDHKGMPSDFHIGPDFDPSKLDALK